MTRHTGNSTDPHRPIAGNAEPVVRLSINLTPQVADELKGYAARKGISVTEAVRRAIGVLSFVDEAQDRGASVNVAEKDGSLKEVLFLV